MHKNQLQELAQRSCFNLPSYACTREGPDHALRFKATVTFNGETFESPHFCSTLRHAEHAAAEVALNTLSRRGPTQSLAARILDETGVCKNLLQETAQRAGVKLPCYKTVRSGPGHMPVFTCAVELAGMTFPGDSSKTKKQAEKNAATVAWTLLKQLVSQGSSFQTTESNNNEEQEQISIARVLATLNKDEKSFRASVAQIMYLMHHGSTAKNRSRIAGQGVTTSTNKASSSSESSAQAGTYMPEPYISSRMSTDLKADGSSAQRHLCGHQHGDVLMKNSSSPLQSGSPQEQYNPRGAAAYAPGSSRDFNAVDRFAAHDICTPIRPMPSVPRTGRRASPSPVEQHNNNNEEQYQWENSAVASNHETNSHSSGDNGFSLVHMPHNPMVWAYPNQWLNRVTQQGSHPSTTSFHAAASLAPPVRVSPMMAVYSAPSYPSGSESGWCERNERQQHGRC